jgi:hypothetical protein
MTLVRVPSDQFAEALVSAYRGHVSVRIEPDWKEIFLKYRDLIISCESVDFLEDIRPVAWEDSFTEEEWGAIEKAIKETS